ncbi:MAG: hypothetical protein EOO01_31955, partial [Chitinophagaceae bacterium]
SSTYTQPPAPDRFKNLATGYKKDGMQVPGKYHIYPEKAAAGLWTTPSDLCKYIIEVQLAYQGRSAKLLNQKMVGLHVTPYGQGDAAMGTFIQNRKGEKYFFHDASNEGFTGVFIAGLTNGKGVAIFANTDDGYIWLELLNSVAWEYGWKGFTKPDEITTVPVSDSVLSKYVGDYITDGTLSGIRKENDGLYYWIDGISSKMYFTSATDFRNIEFSSAKKFIVDSLGNVTGFARSVNGNVLVPANRITTLDTIHPRPGQIGFYGRHLLENKRYERAVQFLLKGVIVEPTDSTILKDLAHAWLSQGDTVKAMEFYQQYLKTGRTESELKEILKKDFDFFLKEGFDSTIIDTAKNNLSL